MSTVPAPDEVVVTGPIQPAKWEPAFAAAETFTVEPALKKPVGGVTVPPIADVVSRYCVVNVAV